MSRTLIINPHNPQPRLLKQVVEVLEKGGIIAYPTDTSYGIGCDIHAPKAIERIYRVKSKDRKQALSFVCSDLSHLADYAVVSNTGYRLMKRLLPGPYTFVLKATKRPPKTLMTKQKTVGIRVPDHAIPLALVALLGRPIVTTTANYAGGPTLDHPEDIEEILGTEVDLIIDSGEIAGELSTVVNLRDAEMEVLREGKGMDALY